MKVLIVKNKYADTPKVYYDWSNQAEYHLSSIIGEVEENILAGYPISLEFTEMTDEEYNKLPQL